MTRLLYSLLMWLAQPFLRIKLRRRGVQEPGYLEAIAERFGHYTSDPAPADGNTLWIHAVSLGETRAAAVLVAALRERWPDLRLLLTHGTATGRAEGARLLQPGDCQAWQPWDTPGAVRRFLAHFQPRLGLLMETEIWPNLVAVCTQRGMPLVLANARLSAASQRKALRLAWLARPAYRGLSAVWAQTPQDAARLAALGASVQGVFGNLKFDAAPDARQLTHGRAWRTAQRRPVVMFASSRPGEEVALLEILQTLRSPGPVDTAPAATCSAASAVQWLIVPRHPQRFDEVAALITEHGFALSRRSHWLAQAPAGGPSGACDLARPALWLGDSLGEMALYYGLADVALLGGSFEPLGGQNLIEAAACACPVVMGPHTFNFAEAAEQALAAGAAQRVENLRAAVNVATALATNNRALEAARQAAQAFARGHRGASARLADALAPWLDGPGRPPALTARR